LGPSDSGSSYFLSLRTSSFFMAISQSRQRQLTGRQNRAIAFRQFAPVHLSSIPFLLSEPFPLHSGDNLAKARTLCVASR
jgi:hypothetical protein